MVNYETLNKIVKKLDKFCPCQVTLNKPLGEVSSLGQLSINITEATWELSFDDWIDIELDDEKFNSFINLIDDANILSREKIEDILMSVMI